MDMLKYLQLMSSPIDAGGDECFCGKDIFDDCVTPIAGTWSIGSNLNTARGGTGGAGTRDAGLAIGGYSTESSCEAFNGNSWSLSASLNSGRGFSGSSGSQIAALVFGGSLFNSTESFNGSSWSAESPLSLLRQQMPGTGTQDASLCFGGYTNANQLINELFDGASWSGSTNLSVAISAHGGLGTTDATLSFGGSNQFGHAQNAVNQFDGVAWTAVSPMTAVRNGVGGAGTTTSGLVVGENTTTTTEEFDGVAWRNSGNSISGGLDWLGLAGSQSSAMFFGAFPTSFVTELYDQTCP